MVRTKPFNNVCYLNINQMSEELYRYFEDLIYLNAPRRTRYRQSRPPWITPSISNLMKTLQAQQQLLRKKPTSYRKRHVDFTTWRD